MRPGVAQDIEPEDPTTRSRRESVWSPTSTQDTEFNEFAGFSLVGLTRDAQARDLLEESLKGILARWRIAALEKAPEMVSAIRRSKVKSNGDVVSISGTLPAAMLRALAASHGEKH